MERSREMWRVRDRNEREGEKEGKLGRREEGRDRKRESVGER